MMKKDDPENKENVISGNEKKFMEEIKGLSKKLISKKIKNKKTIYRKNVYNKCRSLKLKPDIEANGLKVLSTLLKRFIFNLCSSLSNEKQTQSTRLINQVDIIANIFINDIFHSANEIFFYRVFKN